MEVLPASDWSKTTEVKAKEKKNSGIEKKLFKIGRYFTIRCGKVTFYCGDIIQIIEFAHLTSILLDSYVNIKIYLIVIFSF